MESQAQHESQKSEKRYHFKIREQRPRPQSKVGRNIKNIWTIDEGENSLELDLCALDSPHNAKGPASSIFKVLIMCIRWSDEDI